MEPCIRIACLAGLICAFTPVLAHGATPQTRPQPHRASSTQATVRRAPKGPRPDHVHRGNVEGAITLVQLMSTRRSEEEHHRDAAATQDSAVQVRASWEQAGRGSPATLTARAIDSLPPHRDATHLSI